MNEQPEAKSVFLAAVEKASLADRTAFLDEACAGDAELRQRVDALLAAHDKPAIFWNHPFVAVESASADEMATSEHHTAIAETPGTVIDRYKLLEQIGEGGFGVVYMAEQTEPVQRRVALKIVVTSNRQISWSRCTTLFRCQRSSTSASPKRPAKDSLKRRCSPATGN